MIGRQYPARKSVRPGAAAVILLAVALVAPGWAQGRLTTADVAAAARAIVVARVLDVQVRREVNIFTFVDLEVLDTVKGSQPAVFTYRMAGGRLGTVESVGGDPNPAFRRGEEVVLFLGQQSSSDGFPTLYHQQIFRVTTLRGGDKVISPEPSGIVISRARGNGGPLSTVPVRLDDFVHSLKLLR